MRLLRLRLRRMARKDTCVVVFSLKQGEFVFLEEWIHNKIRHTLNEQSGHETTVVTRQAIEDYQLHKLREVLAYASQRNKAYRELLHGISPDSICSLSDLAQIPFLELDDSAQRPYKYLCVSQREIARVFSLSTSGTTGRPKKIFFTMKDAEAITDYMAALATSVAKCSGLSTDGWVGQIFLPDSKPLSHANLGVMGVEKMGGKGFVGFIKAPIEEQVAAIQEVRPTMLVGSASRIHRITEQAKQSLDPGGIGVKTVFITSEYMAEAMRKNLQESWNADVYHHYGMSEAGLAVAIECQAHDGFHYNEAELLFEVVDPQTGRVLKNGETGELVITTLSREATPLIRYKTGDMASLTYKPCICGASTLQTITRIKRRVRHLFTIGEAEEIYPSLFEDVLYTVPGFIDYRVLLSKDGGKDCLTCKVALATVDSGVRDKIARLISNIPQVRKSMQEGFLSEPRIEVVEQRELYRFGRGKQRLIDRR